MVKIVTRKRGCRFILINYINHLAFVGGEGFDDEIRTTLDGWSVSDDNVYTITKNQAESLEQLLTSKGFVVES